MVSREGVVVSPAHERHHISEAEAGRDFAGLMARVRAGAEVYIEDETGTIALLHAAGVKGRTIEESIARMPKDSMGVIDEDFARDGAEAVAAHREPLDSSAWD